MKATQRTLIPLLLAIAMAAVCQVNAGEITLHQTTFPEKKTIDIAFSRHQGAPSANLEAEVKIYEGQASIELKFSAMKPAILFGGDVTSYVLWAITRDGTIENLGELWVREDADRIEYSTGLKSFAMLITGESYPLVSRPSELVLFNSKASDSKHASSAPFLFSDFLPAPEVGNESIVSIPWDKSRPLDVLQAEKAYELAKNEGALEYTPQIMKDARFALGQARNFSAARKKKQTIDYSRRAVYLSGEAIQFTKRRKEREAIEAEIEQRRLEMEALLERTRAAEQQALQAQEQVKQAETAVIEAQLQKKQADAAVAEAQLQKKQAEEAIATTQAALVQLQEQQTALLQEKEQLTAQMAAMQQQQLTLQESIGELEARTERLRQEREQLSARLEGALSQVAETRDSARGFIVNLPDILFDLNQATLKHEARVVIAKLSGILLIMPELNLRVEGHTDATGTEEHNQALSERRAASVRDFLAAQGINMNRMVAVGYGEFRPVATNDTADGRKQNRRVEIIISQGEIAEAEAPN